MYINGRFSQESDILDRIAVSVTDTRADAGNHDVTFQTSARAWASGDAYDWSEEYTASFWRDGRGAYTIDPAYFMPTVRDVPLFPEGDVRPGDSWVAPGSEVHDFRQSFGIEEPFTFPIMVRYVYTGNEDRDGISCAVISIDYEFFHHTAAAPSGQARTVPGAGGRLFPPEVTGGTSRENGRSTTRRTSTSFSPSTRATRSSIAGDADGELLEAQPLDRSRAWRERSRRR